jgi:hypothetical protein
VKAIRRLPAGTKTLLGSTVGVGNPGIRACRSVSDWTAPVVASRVEMAAVADDPHQAAGDDRRAAPPVRTVPNHGDRGVGADLYADGTAAAPDDHD